MSERRAAPKAPGRRGNGAGPMEVREITEEQILALLRGHGIVVAGATIEELCNLHGISNATLVKSSPGQGSFTASDADRLRHLEEENRRLRALVADLTLSNQALKSAVSKKKW